MQIESIEVVLYTAVFLLPGCIIQNILEATNPLKKFSDQSMLFRYLLYSLIHCAIFSWAYLWLWKMKERQPVEALAIGVVISFLGAMALGVILSVIKQKDFAGRLLQKMHLRTIESIPTAWDYAFSKQEAMFVNVILNDDSSLYGAYASNSFASNADEDRDLYLEQVFYKTEDGEWKPVPNNKGVYISGGQIKSLSFYKAG
ncbi:MAG: hypothetical protein II838_11775 [Lachnospiraceae bacterium]|nr:hypothetical protein [Lachnospiraceae bacterium]